MGTSYQITLQTTREKSVEIKKIIDEGLDEINQLMSTYIDDSELSQFNKNQSKECIPLSQQTLHVIQTSVEISKQTQGRFDVTIDPLIAEWGFDRKDTGNLIPSNEKLAELLDNIGYHKLYLGEGCVKKDIASLSVNLSAIAKGYAVDQIAKILDENNIQNYLAEIGGEIASKGVNPKAKPWRLAIEAPVEEQRVIQQIFNPRGLAVATSGDYRNYFEKDNIRFSHTIDPSTGKPIIHKLASVTVLHPQTMYADGYATAFMVMGAKDTLDFANKNDLAVFMIVKTDQGFDTIYSHKFKHHLITNR